MTPTPPTLIDIPPTPQDPFTPTEAPGTPNSAITSMSELSTVAIKDGHRGHLAHQARNAPVPDAERADRISRLAGLERVATQTGRQPTPISQLTPGAAAPPHGGSSTGGGTSAYQQQPGVGYFDATGNPTLGRERSTVGSASATGSATGRTTAWASVTSASDRDKLSESGGDAGDMDMLSYNDRSSVGGGDRDINDGVSSRADDDMDTRSLVGFGEGARTPARASAYGGGGGGAGGSGSAFGKPGPLFRGQGEDMDGVVREGVGAQVAEKILKERIGTDEHAGLKPAGAVDTLGKFEFEEK